MGLLCCKASPMFVDFSLSVKDEVKLKSVFQYQTAHFKMLTLEQKKLPDFQAITETKIMRIKNNRRLEELKKISQSIPPKIEDTYCKGKIKEPEKNLENGLNFIKQEILEYLKIEDCLLESKKKLGALKTFKKILQDRVFSNDVEIHKDKIIRKKSLSIVENQISSVVKPKNNEKQYSKYKQKLVDCVDKYKHLKTRYEQVNFFNGALKNKRIFELNQDISVLIDQRDELRALKNLESVDTTFGNSIDKIATEVTLIKLEYEKVTKLNDMLSTELSEFINK